MTTRPLNHVGIDVSKDILDLAILEQNSVKQYSNAAAGIADLVAAMQQLSPAMIVVEATGGYERAVVQDLFEAC